MKRAWILYHQNILLFDIFSVFFCIIIFSIFNRSLYIPLSLNSSIYKRKMYIITRTHNLIDHTSSLDKLKETIFEFQVNFDQYIIINISSMAAPCYGNNGLYYNYSNSGVQRFADVTRPFGNFNGSGNS